jgi:hypothetical protein
MPRSRAVRISLDASFDVHHGVGEARITAVESYDLGSRRGHLPERSGERTGRRDDVDDLTFAKRRHEPTDGVDNRVDLGLRHQFEGSHRLHRDVPFEIQRRLGEQITEGASAGERSRERGCNGCRSGVGERSCRRRRRDPPPHKHVGPYYWLFVEVAQGGESRPLVERDGSDSGAAPQEPSPCDGGVIDDDVENAPAETLTAKAIRSCHGP